MYIVQYKCSYEKCNFHTSLAGCIPVWKKGTPEEFQRVPVGTFTKKYFDYYRFERVCWGCRTVVTVDDKGSGECPNCHTKKFFMQPGWACHACNFGVIQEIEDMTKWF